MSYDGMAYSILSRLRLTEGVSFTKMNICFNFFIIRTRSFLTFREAYFSNVRFAHPTPASAGIYKLIPFLSLIVRRRDIRV